MLLPTRVDSAPTLAPPTQLARRNVVLGDGIVPRAYSYSRRIGRENDRRHRAAAPQHSATDEAILHVEERYLTREVAYRQPPPAPAEVRALDGAAEVERLYERFRGRTDAAFSTMRECAGPVVTDVGSGLRCGNTRGLRGDEATESAATRAPKASEFGPLRNRLLTSLTP